MIRQICALLLLIAIIIGVSQVRAQAVSMWVNDGPESISSTDYFGNKITFVCERGYYDMFLETKDNIAETYYALKMSLWASRFQRLEFRSTVVARNKLRIRLNETEEMYNLIENLNERYDLSILVQANKRDELFQFSLDGFADRFLTLCEV